VKAQFIAGIAGMLLAAVLFLLDIPGTTPAPIIVILIVGIGLAANSKRTPILKS